ncbi:protein-S-isoprenylcysteine methyltransferase [Novosphingobium sp. FSY-8]|uniref:Protein-S-isoprenylcysteine methyltransferase n=1 Tax=Novosphingobium ovatum TaxID=1908523 RepID=A0ABW9XF82_9SPHN|nr:isoprenylcysteine carboxylmethyltransferase family protein [Novosphingobium ovatum]NBC37191.1 protein-S-isoprenylcysteine methyltransferase [Novosphingobium ovatum]
MTLVDHLLYAVAWGLFGLSHSLLAGAGPRQGLGRLFGRAHRLAYNVLALVTIALVLALGVWLSRGDHGFAMPRWLMALRLGIVASGLVLGLFALRAYRLGPFVGWSQFRGEEDDGQTLVVTDLHRHMRHPLYTAALLLLWGRVDGELTLATAIWGSLYLAVGSHFEERRLMTRYGEAYRRYRAITPRFFPRLF